MAYKKSFKCILLVTNDKRHFFTYKRYLKHVTEYFKTFGAEVYLASAENLHVLELKELVSNICDSKLNQNGIKFTIIEKLYPIKVKSRDEIVQAADKIKAHIRKEFLRRETVSLKKIKSKFQDFGLSDSCFSNHLSRVRKELEDEGNEIVRTGLGKYQIR